MLDINRGLSATAEVAHELLVFALTSPPRSALAFATWLQEHALGLHAPLRSVELLLSVVPGDGSQPPADLTSGATRAGIEAALARWRARCDRHDDNVAYFFSCGHG
jgi:hypothetical protein